MKNRIQKISFLLSFVLLLSSCSNVDYNRLLNVSMPSVKKVWFRFSDYEYRLGGMKEGELFKETKEKTVGIKLLLDKRSLGSKFRMRKLKNFSEIATRKLIESFSEMFKEIHYPPEYDEDIIIEGRINRFFGDAHPAFIYSPFDIYQYGITTITLKIKDNKRNQVIAKVKKSSSDWGGGCWSFGKWDVTEYINYAFSQAMVELKARCLWELKKYYSNKQI